MIFFADDFDSQEFKDALDRHITGNYGEDQDLTDIEEDENILCDYCGCSPRSCRCDPPDLDDIPF